PDVGGRVEFNASAGDQQIDARRVIACLKPSTLTTRNRAVCEPRTSGAKSDTVATTTAVHTSGQGQCASFRLRYCAPQAETQLVRPDRILHRSLALRMFHLACRYHLHL